MTKPNGQCRVCQHVERWRIELLLASGASIRSISVKFTLPYYGLRRHWLLHVSDERKAGLKLGPVQQAALAARISEENSSVLDHLRVVRAGLYHLYDAAVEAGDRPGGSLLAGRLHENLNSLAKLTGELAQSPLVMKQTNVFIASPEFALLQAAIIRALAPFPDARSAVIQAFRDMETGGQPPLLEHGSQAA